MGELGLQGRCGRSWLPGVLLVVVGAAFVLTDAFTGAIWFDESFSVAMASHSFSEIWDIGALDVHPILYYWMLHVVYLLFGQNLVAYRVLTAAGTVALAVLGVTAVRKDYGRAAGFTFALLAFILPHAASMAVQLRMYSWASFAVGCCLVFALRICRSARAGKRVRPWHWLVFAASSLAAAYLHYFGAMAAFIINLLLLCCLVRRAKKAPRQLLAFVVSTIAQLALYAPWLLKLMGQLSAVSSSYWIQLTSARLAQMLVYPLVTTQMLDAVRGLYGPVARVITLFACGLAALLLLGLLALFIRFCREVVRNRRMHSATNSSPTTFDAGAVGWGVAVYAGTVGIAVTASLAMGSLIAVARYFYVALPALLLAIAIATSALLTRRITAVALACVVLVGLCNQALLLVSGYNPANQAPIDELDRVWAEGAPMDGDATADRPLVLSSNTLAAGTLAITNPDIPQVFIADGSGQSPAFEAVYAPTLTFVSSADTALKDYHGRFIVLDEDNAEENDVYAVVSLAGDLAAREDIEVVSSRTFYRPYERNNYTISVLEAL